jgi:hypothetical protein
MKFNKWTLGLAAVGAVSLASVARADDVTNSLLTAVASTTISGYVDTSANWTPGTGNAIVPGYSYNSTSKTDGFNVDSVDITLQKAEDETEWASGYDVDVFLGPDAAALGTGFSLKQAYVTLRTPVGTGIDWKLGVWDTIIGYESTEDLNNPNFTRSYGYTIEPTSHTGLNGTYKISDALSITLGVADTSIPSAINSRPSGEPAAAESYKTYMGALSFTAPTNWGFASGSTAYVGFINGWNGGAVQQNLYLGTTMNTPLSSLTVGASYDYAWVKPQNYDVYGTPAGVISATYPSVSDSWGQAFDLYSSYQATDKLSLNTRVEYFWQSEYNPMVNDPNSVTGGNAAGTPNKIFAFTETATYNLWKNVISRVEFRWDHQAGRLSVPNGTAPAVTEFGAYGGQQDLTGPGGLTSTKHNDYQFMANIIYKF